MHNMFSLFIPDCLFVVWPSPKITFFHHFGYTEFIAINVSYLSWVLLSIIIPHIKVIIIILIIIIPLIHVISSEDCGCDVDPDGSSAYSYLVYVEKSICRHCLLHLTWHLHMLYFEYPFSWTAYSYNSC